jgi:hypothetical protein
MKITQRKHNRDIVVSASTSVIPETDGGVEPSHYYWGHYWPIVPAPDDDEWMSMEQSVEWLEEETEVLRKNLPNCRFVHHKSHMTWPGLESGSPRWEATNGD